MEAGPLGHPQLHALVVPYVPYKEMPALRLLSRDSRDLTDKFFCEDVLEYFMKGSGATSTGDVEYVAVFFLRLKLLSDPRFQDILFPVLFDEYPTPAKSAIEAADRKRCRGNAWIRLGFIMKAFVVSRDVSLTIAGRGTFNQLECFEKGLSLNPRNSPAWEILAASFEEVTINGKDYDRVEMLRMGVEGDPSYPNVWFKLGYELFNEYPRSVEIHGKHYNAIECYVVANKLTPDCAAWQNIGLLLEFHHGGEELVDGKRLTSLDCYIEALRLDPETGKQWLYVAYRMVDAAETVTVLGKTYNRLQCFARAWELLPEPSVGEVDGSGGDEEEEVDVSRDDVWRILTETMVEGETIELRGSTWTKRGDNLVCETQC